MPTAHAHDILWIIYPGETPSQNTLDRVLRRKLRAENLILTAHINASGVKAKIGETPRSVTNGATSPSKNITCTYTLMTALRLYVVIVF
jgi:hypothetical protein